MRIPFDFPRLREVEGVDAVGPTAYEPPKLKPSARAHKTFMLEINFTALSTLKTIKSAALMTKPQGGVVV
ncbi:hypothetical protein Pres01_39590 [Metapseudomonas resinovorans]|nr:hypothetical protein Pres01_39590 [Pseudomonas resinovorans]